VLINIEAGCSYKGLQSNYVVEKDFDPNKKANISLESCFKEFGAEELLSGND